MRKISGLLIGVLLLAVGGVALASIPDGNGVIHGCVKDGTTGRREVRVIDTAFTTTCGSGWTEVTWSQEGPQGPTGAAGATGPAGEPTHWYTESGSINGIPAGGSAGTTVHCDVGDVAISSGWDNAFYSATADLYLDKNRPPSPSDPTAWEFAAVNPGPEPDNLQVLVRCADFAPFRT
jgi:hypothetical protein